MSFCSNCGASLTPGMKFCENCGTPVPAAPQEPKTEQAAPAQPTQGGYTPPAQQTQGGYTPPAQPAQGGYTPPAQQTQGGYTPPTQPAQGGYTPPAQQTQGGYTPPAQQTQGGYTPPTQPAQGGYTPPAQQTQGGYTPPAQQTQGGYVPPAQRQYGAQAAYTAPQAVPGQKKPFNKKLLLWGGIGLAAILIVVLAVSLLGKGDPHVGIWNGTTLEAEGVTLDIAKDMGEGAYVFDIQKGGACVLTFGPETLNGTWEKSKDGILIKAGEYTFDCKVKGTTMVIENYADSGMTLTLEKTGGKGGTASSDPNVGIWQVEYAEMWGFETDIRDVFENGFTIELLDKGKCKLNIDGTESSGKWTLEDGVFTIKGGGLDTSGTLKGGVLVLEDVLGTGLKLTFRKEGAQSGSSTGDGFPSIWGTGFQSPTTSIELGSYWYGTAIISNFTPANRADEVEGSHDVWGYIGTASDGRDYFEVFDEPELTSDPLLSMYIDLYGYAFAADIGDEDAWLMGTYLDDSANVFFSPELDNGALVINYYFQEQNASFDFELFLREDGAPWDEDNDPLPPGYDEYKAQLDGGTQNGGGSEPPATAEFLSAAQLREAYDSMSPSGMTYEEVRDVYMHGVEGEKQDQTNPDIYTYRWYAAEGKEQRLSVSFKKNAAGKYVYTSRSTNNIP